MPTDRELPQKRQAGSGGWNSGRNWLLVNQNLPENGVGVGLGGHRDSGALTPNRSRPTDKPTRADSTSHSRAWVNSGLTPSPTT